LRFQELQTELEKKDDEVREILLLSHFGNCANNNNDLDKAEYCNGVHEETDDAKAKAGSDDDHSAESGIDNHERNTSSVDSALSKVNMHQIKGYLKHTYQLPRKLQ
jgi:hypothetical protein